MATKTARRSPQRSTQSGIAFDILEPGGFYQCVQPGGCTDAQTGITIPGPKATLDGSTKRVVVALTDIPDPVQLPHVKIVLEMSEGGKVRKEVEADFNRNDEQPVHEFFQLALATGQIRMVSDDEMEEKYPDAWAARSEHLVYRTENVSQGRPLIDLLHEAEERNEYASKAANLKVAEQNSLDAIDTPRRAAGTVMTEDADGKTGLETEVDENDVPVRRTPPPPPPR